MHTSSPRTSTPRAWKTILAPFLAAAIIVPALLLEPGTASAAGAAAVGSQKYDDFETPRRCSVCHVDVARQHEQAMMSQAYTHAWDEIEYFELALPHAEKEPKVAGIKAGCNGCHAPLAFLSGDIPPQRPQAGTRANEAVSCDICHTIVGFEGEIPVNGNYVVSPGKVKQGTRSGAKPSGHETVESAFLKTAEFCGTCHNEQDPWGVYVKSTHLEWKESPQARAGIVCQDCHMPPAEGQSARNGEVHPDVRQHLFHGAHDKGKLAGVVEVRIHPERREAEPGDRVKLTAVVVNAKAGHSVPSGSAEERLLWLDVEATDSAGHSWHLAVEPKGFEGEELTIASAGALAYQDIGEIRGEPGFQGLLRDKPVPAGDRIFRLPYLDPQGRMTVAQWNTASQGPDYRLRPLQAVAETYLWEVPGQVAQGPVTVHARVYYSRLVASVAEYLGVPDEEWEPVLVSEHTTTLNVVD
jgi:hypothetical protein